MLLTLRHSYIRPVGAILDPLGVEMRKTTFLGFLVGGLLMSSASVLAQATSTPAAAPTTPAAPAMQPTPHDDPDEIICRSGQPELGSRFPGPRTCHTRREWDQIQRDSQSALFQQQMERSANGGH